MKRFLAKEEFNQVSEALSISDHGELTQTIDHNKIHAWLGIKTPATQWVKRCIDKYKFVEGIDYVRAELEKPFPPSSQNLNNFGNISNLRIKSVFYHCSVEMVKHLAMVSGGEKGAQVRKYFLDCEQIAREKEESKKLTDEYKPMSLALKESRALEGKETSHFHYSNEANLINSILLGTTAKKYREMHGMKKDEPIKSNLTELELRAFDSLQRANTVLIELGFSYSERKERLAELYNRWWKAPLIEEVHLINS